MALKSGLSVAIMSAVFVSQLILQTEAQTGATRTPRPITFDCDPEQLHGAARLTCLARRFEEGRRLFDEETFQGNGRTCVTCHSVRTGTFSPEDAQERLAANPGDPLFVGDGLDDGVFGTSRIDRARDRPHRDPASSARQARERPGGDERHAHPGDADDAKYAVAPAGFMYDGRDLTLEAQALGAVHAHAQNGFEPTPLQLELIAEFQRTSPRFFSSLPLFLFARGGPPPRLPNGVTASEKRGRAMFDDVPITPGSTRGLCAMCHSGPMLDVSNEFNIFLPDLPGLRFFGVGVTERNKLNLPTYEFIVDGTDRIVTPDPGACLTDPPDPNEFPPELFGPGGPLPLIIACSLFKTPSLWGVRHTAPYFHDNSSKTLKEVAEQYTFMFRLFAGITLTPQDEADIVAFLRLL